MKRFFMNILMMSILLAYGNSLYAQTLPDFDLIKLDKVSDHKKAEPFVLQTANYMLSSPVEKSNPNRVKALEFLYKWMSGTPDYSFNLQDARNNIGKGSEDILGVYMAAMAKYTLQNKDSAKDAKLMKLNAVILLLNYCENKSNNIKIPKHIKALSEARTRGELEKSL